MQEQSQRKKGQRLTCEEEDGDAFVALIMSDIFFIIICGRQSVKRDGGSRNVGVVYRDCVSVFTREVAKQQFT